MLLQRRFTGFIREEGLALVRYISSASPSSGTKTGDYASATSYKSIPKEPFYKSMIRAAQDNSYMLKMHINMNELHKVHGPIFRMGLPGVGEAIMFNDPEDLKTLIYTDDKDPIEHGFNFVVEYRQNIRKDLYPETGGLLGSHGEKWYQARSKVQQDMLRPKSAFFYIDEITGVSNDLMNLVASNMNQDRTIDDVTPLMYRWSLEAVSAIFLDTRIGCLKADPPKEAKEMIAHTEIALGFALNQLTFGLPLWKLYRTKHLDDFDTATEGIHKITSKFIGEAKDKFKANNITETDKMSVLQKLIHKCGTESKIPEVMAMDAMMAGIDTTGNTAAFLIYHLASNPVQQEILYKEIKDKLGDNKLTPAILNEMKYLKAVQHESQRLLPAVGGLGRTTQKDMVLSGYQIPRGSMVSFMWTMPMRSEKHFKNSDEFMPERWLRGCPQQNNAHPFAFTPFGHGSRMCIGRRFAELEIQILAIETLRRYKLVYEGSPMDLCTPFVNRPDGPIAVKFIERQ